MQKYLLDKFLEIELLSQRIHAFYVLADIAKQLFTKGMWLFTPPATVSTYFSTYTLSNTLCL